MIRVWLGKAIGYAICEPQLRLGRRRHDNVCDDCGEECGTYSMEKLTFPVDPDRAEEVSAGAKIRAMFDAEYFRICLDCSVTEGDDGE